MKRLMAAEAALLVVAAVLSACSVKDNNTSSRPPGGAKEITFLTFETPIDGAGPVRRFRSVTWPLLAPTLTATIAFNVLQTGFDVDQIGRHPVALPAPPTLDTVTSVLLLTVLLRPATASVLIFLATLPVLVFYFVLHKQFVKGLTGGAVKG